MKRTLVAAALAVIFVLAIAAPALAASLTHTATYEMDGTIDFKKQAGHKCNTGAEFKQVISGSGKMDKAMTVDMVKGKLTLSDVNDWVAGATPLTVTSVWELCTPPKMTYETVDGYDVPVHPLGGIYGAFPYPAYWDGDSLEGINWDMLADGMGYDLLTSQIWAVQVKADPGFSGNLHQKGTAAYGGGVAGFLGKPTGMDSDKWSWGFDDDGVLERQVGDDFVGDFFTMDQFARTSQGTLKRYIDVSSPWSGALLMQDMSVVGKSEVKEYFTMPNIPAGAEILKDWWDLF